MKVSEPAPRLVKASLTLVESLDTVTVLWNPSRYRLERRNVLQSQRVVGGDPPEFLEYAGSRERFDTELFVDTTDREPGPERDARQLVDRLARWMSPLPGEAHPPRVVFVWGPFRFAGAVESLTEEWIRFDPDGTPVRAWISLVLRA